MSATDGMHWLDRAFGAFLSRTTMFGEGWGDPALLDLLSRPAPTEDAAGEITITWDVPRRAGGVCYAAGTFRSPAADILPEHGVSTARVELLAPTAAIRDGGKLVLAPETPLCLHLASSGEEGFMRRRMFALPLVRRGIASLFLENPFYGRRRRRGQGSYLLGSVADQLAMNRATVREARALLTYFHARGVERLAASGYSMGGFTSAVTVTRCAFPVAAIPCAAGISPAPVFVEGVLSRSVDWPALRGDQPEENARARLGSILHAVADYLITAPKPQAAIIVAARDDGFVRARDVEALARAWPDAELRWLAGGHVSAYVRHQSAMRRAIVDAIARL